jgi:hypothetical protein
VSFNQDVDNLAAALEAENHSPTVANHHHDEDQMRHLPAPGHRDLGLSGLADERDGEVTHSLNNQHGLEGSDVAPQDGPTSGREQPGMGAGVGLAQVQAWRLTPSAAKARSSVAR